MIYDKGQETFTLLKGVKVHYEKPASIRTEAPNKKGNAKENVDPSPKRDSTQILPFIWLTRLLHIESPRPDPPYCLLDELST